MNSPLRVGVVLESMQVPAWLYQQLDALRQSPHVALDRVLLASPNPSGPSRVPSRYGWFDEKLFARDATRNAFALRDVALLLAGLPISSVPDAWAQPFGCDVLLDGTSGPPDRSLATLTRQGYWTLRHLNSAGTGSIDFRELTFQMQLVRLAPNPAQDRVLYRSWSAVQEHSAFVSHNHAAWKAATFAPRVLARLHRLGEAAFEASLGTETPVHFVGAGTPTGAPGALVKRVLQRLFTREEWLLAYGWQPGGPSPDGLARFQLLAPPPDRFWADPFVICENGRYFVFFEDLPYATNRGHLSVLELQPASGTYTTPVPILEKPYHLSYPFVFRWQGGHWLVPESAEAGTVQLYRATRFPDQWEFVQNLLAGMALVDATLLERGGRWWLFGTVVEPGITQPWDELSIFFTDDLLSGTWTPHPLNPVVSDVRRARPAGRIFEKNGKLYRPAQDSSGRYGAGLKLLRIDVLTETEYRETEVAAAVPDWNPALHGLHTLNHDDGLTVIDLFRYRRRF
jgi:hypothetical protein